MKFTTFNHEKKKEKTIEIFIYFINKWLTVALPTKYNLR